MPPPLLPSTPNTYLKDSSNQVWLLGVTNAGAYTTFPVTGQVGNSFILLNDTAIAQVWKLTVQTNGALRIDPATGMAQANIPVIAPNGTLFGIVVTNNAISTVLLSQCLFSLGDAVGALASRLYDSTNQFWPQSELILYIQEALRTWNALTGYWRGDFTFQAQQGTVWYDLTDSVAIPNTLRPLTLTDVALYNIIEAHLLEPIVGAGPWTGSTQFAINDILTAVQRGRDEALGITGCTVSHRVLPAVTGRIVLPKTVIDIRRNVYIDPQGRIHVLWKSDYQTWLGYTPGYTTAPPGTPHTYSISAEPVFTFDVDIPPLLPATYELLTVETGAALSVTSPSFLSVPDDWAWVIKWKALAELLGREAEPKDTIRQTYCEMRYQQGVKLLSLAPAMLALRIGNQPIFLDSVKSADAYQPSWEGQAQGTPNLGLIAGLNLIALAPPAKAGNFSVTATVVENAPVPFLVSDCVLLTVDLVDVILDYAQHLASFKMGGEEFKETFALYDRFIKQALLYSSKLGAQSAFHRELVAMSQKQELHEPRYKEDEEEAPVG